MARLTTSQFAGAVAKSAAWAGITLIDPNRQSGWRKHAYWLAMAGGAAAEIAAPMNHDDTWGHAPGLVAGAALATAGLTYGAHDLLAKGDAWSIRQLERLGLKHPRVWAAGFVFASMLAMSMVDAAERRAQTA